MHQNPSSFADRLAELTRHLAEEDSPLSLGLWERGTALRIGKITQAIKGVRKRGRRIEDGYQYVGGFPAHMWKMATADPQYKTLSHGIDTFSSRWDVLRAKVRSRMHYVSIGPGTGEKDAAVLKHLASLARTPFQLDLYQLALTTEAAELADRAEATFAIGQVANEHSDAYVLNVVFLATVLFLAGIAQQFDWVRLQMVLLGVGTLMLAVGVYNIIAWPML